MLDPDPYPDPHKINADPQPCGQAVRIRVADPYSFDTDPDPAFFRLNTDPDQAGRWFESGLRIRINSCSGW